MSSKDRQIAELTETVARLEQKIVSLSSGCERGRVDSTTAAEIADRLLNLMGDISEEVYYAGWLIDLEFTLWAIAERAVPPGEVGEERATELRKLATECSGWWRWDEAAGNVFMSLPEWRRMVDERQASRVAQGAQ